MGEPVAVSARSKWLVLVVAVVAAASGFAIASWSGSIFPREWVYPSPAKIEKIYFDSSSWSDASSLGNITEVTLAIMNTGADELIIGKVFVNGTLLDSTDWESFPSMRFEPGDQGALNITPSSMTFKEGTTYEFTIETLAGNSFSYSSLADDGIYPFRKTEDLKVISIDRSTWSNTTATLTLKNSGTSELTIISVKVNGNAAPMSPPTATLAPGDQQNFTVEYITYMPGTKYEFAFYTASGNRYPYTATAP